MDGFAKGKNERATPSVPDGYVLVPIKPTNEMVEAGVEHTKTEEDEESDQKLYRAKGQALAVWHFMIEAYKKTVERGR